ncbi:uncharacterized protein [Diadema antillarum]|uniref:uncharacterized protein n=1 Tax=Diadema antillarum TaxID=105358 RepID=UPI003A8C7544
MNNFLSIGEYIQPSTDPCTIAEDDTGTVAASTGRSENVSKSGLPHDYPAADVIVLKFKPACLPEREISNTTACFDYNPLSDDVELVSETVPSSQITASSTAGQLSSTHRKTIVIGRRNDGKSSKHLKEVNASPSVDQDKLVTAGQLSSTHRKTIVIGRRNDGKSSKHLKEVNVSPSVDQDKLVTAGQLSSTPRKTIVIGKRNDGKSSKHLKEVYALPSSDHDYCITSDMMKEGRTKGSKRKSTLTPRSELADIPTDQQGQTTKQFKRGKKVCKRTTQVVKKSDPGSETESEEGYDSNDPDYLPSNDVEEEKEYNPRRYHVEKYMILAKRYRCSICVKSFLSILDFDKHMDSNHDVQGEVFRSELLQLLEEKKTPEVLERYKEELRKRGLNPEAVGRRRPPSIQFQRRTRMQTRASKRRTEQEGMVGKTNDEGDRDHSHLSGDGQPENMHPAEVSVEKRTAGVKPTEESPSRNEKQGSSVEGTIGVEGKDAGSIPVSHNLTEMTGDDIVNALASMLEGREDLSDELTEDHREAGLLDIEGKVEPGDSERREGSPDRTLVDQEGDAQQSTDVGMHDEQKSSETGNGSKNVANAESEWKDELKSFSLDQDVDIVCWMGGWSDIFLECEICKAHIYLYRIYRHLSSHREVMHCMNCNFWHVSESLFKAHLQSCQEKESSVCELCGESYKDVRLHMRLEHTYTYGKKKAKMKASKKKTPASGHTARKGILNRYVSLARRYRCTICRELFSSIHGFHKHMDGNHDMQGEAFRSGLLEILEEKTLQAVQKRLKELQTIRRKEETKLRKLQGLQKSGNLSECWQPSRVNDGSTGMHTRASNRRTEQEGVMVKRKDEGEGDCSHLSGKGKPENIHPPADEETPGTVQGDDGQGKDDGGLQNGYRGDYESSLSKKCSFEATALENPGELCVLEGEREKGSISCEGMTVEESLSRDTMMALNNVMADQTALSFSEKTIRGIIPAIATSPAEENSSRFEKQGSCDKGTISAEGTDATNIPISNESAEDDISDVLTSMLGGEKTLLSALTDEQFGTTCEAGLLNIGELEAGDSERREGSPDRTLVDQEENAEQRY